MLIVELTKNSPVPIIASTKINIIYLPIFAFFLNLKYLNTTKILTNPKAIITIYLIKSSIPLNLDKLYIKYTVMHTNIPTITPANKFKPL